MNKQIMITPAEWLEPYSPGERASLKARAMKADEELGVYLMETGHSVDAEGWVYVTPIHRTKIWIRGDQKFMQILPLEFTGERITIITRTGPIDVQQVTMPFAIGEGGTRVERESDTLAVFNVGNLDAA